MRIALFSDIHGNAQAFEAALQAASEAGAERIVILGDIVGYGGDPGLCVDKVRALKEQGALVVRGNHDQAIGDPTISLNDTARSAIHWTRDALDDDQKAFLANLPLMLREEDRLYVHAEAGAPPSFHYVTDAQAAAEHFAACEARVSFCGHVHRPALYASAAGGKVITFVPHSQIAIPLLPQRRWLAVIGSVGQPRDGESGAAFALMDTTAGTLSFLRAEYDIDAAAAAIRAAGLSETLATRLYRGR
ncbi:metallophosphoesterase family protein [Allorhizobium taibaishanense]|uniref:Diadenosine tetraphosphatase ApaH/serine/threonine PP2A family protein phosphatase n=1 Tax=Allorhizobium taibaishanense TaxID=887144 RepID=A0A1Q9A8Z9_9HYPH|nr:metallophosphoesterase family protein [Allorhizobium taibaishanense]MBB4009359.1 diadenosine tetraphosphatase ApaH/serine/threonine PP2A family protein phosphatase [Allorhizobium taibaishanense]OLP51086.1 metallophosphoesterase [Allorhizobium taibaishanense]